MDNKLKSLKVVDLKNILHAANIALPPKANKADLIAKILASPNAILAFENQQVRVFASLVPLPISHTLTETRPCPRHVRLHASSPISSPTHPPFQHHRDRDHPAGCP